MFAPTSRTQKVVVVVMIRERIPPNSAVMIDELRRVTRNPR
jgi:hypothetical protein